MRQKNSDLEKKVDDGFSRRDFLGKAGKYLAGALIAGSIFSNYSFADSVYYGIVKEAKTPAYIDYERVKKKSEYYSEIPGKDDANYDKEVTKINEKILKNVKSAVSNVAKEKSYDVVVNKNDPKIDNYVDITDLVIKELKKVEKKY